MQIALILENGNERDVIFADGSSITQFYCKSMKMWVCIPENEDEA